MYLNPKYIFLLIQFIQNKVFGQILLIFFNQSTKTKIIILVLNIHIGEVMF